MRTPAHLIFALWFIAATIAIADDASFFRTQVEPLLREKCFSCHSHASDSMEGNLALDWRSGWENGGDRGPAIIPGEPASSLLMRAVSHEDPTLQMPDEKLSDEELKIIATWIERGAFDDRVGIREPEDALDWWSLRSLVAPAIPLVVSPETSSPAMRTSPSEHAVNRGDTTSDFGLDNPIDAFVIERLQAAGLAASPPADSRTLIRRVTLDLWGLPPTPGDVAEFLADARPDAYEHLVDRLLQSPRYGERWARHWFDTIHFADSHGYEHDVGRDHAWRFRDYAIQALNEDIAWPRFIREQLAVDYFQPEATERTPALGFLGAGTFDLSTFSTAKDTFDYLARDDLVAQTMSAFASTTANCARCHAHKFDPVSQEDYYALQAVFAGVLKGDLAFDAERDIARQRADWDELLVACDQQEPTRLLAPEWIAVVQKWVALRASTTTWQALDFDTFTSSGGATLTRQTSSESLTASDPSPTAATGFVLASGPAPDQDTYVITAKSQMGRATALRLDVFPHESLPTQGPGRCHNGNLHLSEVAVSVFAPGAKQGLPVALRNASADFNQTGWGIERAIDGDPTTAWGIYPEVGVQHHAVFEFVEPIDLPADARIAVTLRQLHGGAHLIGAFQLSLTEDDPSAAAAVPNAIHAILAQPEDARSQAQRTELAAYVLRRVAQQAIDELPPKVFVYAAAKSVLVPAGDGPRQAHQILVPKPVHLLKRGDFDKPLHEVGSGALSALAQLPGRFHLENPVDEAQRRAALADWLASPHNPLTWRSIVNRVWHYHFGAGICDTPSDFGRMGGLPSHPELLDWLAVWFRDEAGGSLKRLHRLIVTSAVYQQSSLYHEQSAAVDQDNRLLWRFSPQRMDADAVRDSMLSAAGRLDVRMGGPGVQHFHQSPGPQATPALDYTSYDWTQVDAGRRSIYRVVWRGIPDPFMESIDFPDLGLLSPARGFSTSSLQALAMFNDAFVLTCSQALETSVIAELGEPASPEQLIEHCVERVWLRKPTASEMAAFGPLVYEHGLAALCRVLFNSNEFLFVD